MKGLVGGPLPVRGLGPPLPKSGPAQLTNVGRVAETRYSVDHV